jgi:hypothetical protein
VLSSADAKIMPATTIALTLVAYPISYMNLLVGNLIIEPANPLMPRIPPKRR